MYNLTNKNIDEYGSFNGKDKFLIFKGYLVYNKDTKLDNVNVYKINDKLQLIENKCKLEEENPKFKEASIVKRLETTGLVDLLHIHLVLILYNRNYTKLRYRTKKRKIIH